MIARAREYSMASKASNVIFRDLRLWVRSISSGL